MTRHPILPILAAAWVLAPAGETFAAEPTTVPALVSTFCASCHDAGEPKGELNLMAVASEDIGRHPEVWEKVVRRLRARQMPPAGRKRPDEDTYTSVLSQLETALDRAAAQRPNSGRTDTIRR